MIGSRHTYCVSCGKIIPKGTPKVSVGAMWRCPDCEYLAQQAAKPAAKLRRVK